MAGGDCHSSRRIGTRRDVLPLRHPCNQTARVSCFTHSGQFLNYFSVPSHRREMVVVVVVVVEEEENMSRKNKIKKSENEIWKKNTNKKMAWRKKKTLKRGRWRR
ncbi:hypothetical protein E2C01_022773 [Portunus trituberculatus]|uniref:Uncharacterized protein n=1 Tax=Portunus trituberculatus TaxID=210409 RepID=A0A5B7E9R8_PORTR|nr:hypothetical protein [Portunus trituberculatus]